MKRTVLMFVVVLSLLICGYAQSQEQSPSEAADQYIQYFKTDDFLSLYSNMCQVAKSAMSSDILTDLIKVEKEILGNVSEYSLVDTLEKTAEGKTETVFNYVVDFERGQGVINLSLINEDGALKVLVFHLDSPAFLKPKAKELLRTFQLQHSK